MKKKNEKKTTKAKARKATPSPAVKVTKTKRGFHVQHEIDPLTGKPWEKGERPAHHKEPKAPASARESKSDIIMGLISRSGGATLQEIMDATSWISKSVRGFIATRNKTTPIKSEKDAAGARRYTLVGA